MGSAEGVAEGSVANLDNVHLLRVDLLLRQAGSVDEARWHEFCAAMGAVMSC